MPVRELQKSPELLPRLESRWRALVGSLDSALVASGIPLARTALRGIVGEIRVVKTPNEIRLETQKGAVESALLRAAAGQQINLVAGAGFGQSVAVTSLSLPFPATCVSRRGRDLDCAQP
jgi:hypothetical protein